MKQVYDQQIENTAIITLNRPLSLNALSSSMCELLIEFLLKWKDSSVDKIIIKGEGKSFCAGGDIKSVYIYRKKGELQSIKRLFDFEYRLIKLLYEYPKPIITMVQGLCFGGGMGFVFPSKMRIVNETSKFAMPEVKISFFPDIGSTFFLKSYFPYGIYMGLTGRALEAGDLLSMGLATHYCPQDKWRECEEMLIQTPYNKINMKYSHGLSSPLTAQRDVLCKIFSPKTWKEFWIALSNSSIQLAQDIRQELLQNHPLSMKLFFCRYHREQNFDQIIQEDHYLSSHFLHFEDFYEGIRAAVVDKDKKPCWNYPLLNYFNI